MSWKIVFNQNTLNIIFFNAYGLFILFKTLGVTIHPILKLIWASIICQIGHINGECDYNSYEYDVCYFYV